MNLKVWLVFISSSIWLGFSSPKSLLSSKRGKNYKQLTMAHGGMWTNSVRKTKVFTERSIALQDEYIHPSCSSFSIFLICFCFSVPPWINKKNLVFYLNFSTLLLLYLFGFLTGILVITLFILKSSQSIWS